MTDTPTRDAKLVQLLNEAYRRRRRRRPDGAQAHYDGRGLRGPDDGAGQRAFERVLVAHGEPVYARSDFIAALDREP